LSEAIVVGSGPNGLACAVELARNGVQVTVLEAADRIGGGTRTSELTVPGLLHDDCSATHPMAVGSPFLRSLELESHGLEWLWPEIDLAHPLDDGSAGVMVRSIDETAKGLGEDGEAWRRVFGSPSAHFGELLEDILQPVLHVPRTRCGWCGSGWPPPRRPRSSLAPGGRPRQGRCSAASPPMASA
jgi:phytoene dehydrogenase-like protein